MAPTGSASGDEILERLNADLALDEDACVFSIALRAGIDRDQPQRRRFVIEDERGELVAGAAGGDPLPTSRADTESQLAAVACYLQERLMDLLYRALAEPTFHGGGTGLRAGVDLDDNAALLDLMDADDAAPADDP